MALNDVALCSRALIRIGAAPITSFNDGTAESEIAGALYEKYPRCITIQLSLDIRKRTGSVNAAFKRPSRGLQLRVSTSKRLSTRSVCWNRNKRARS